MSNIHLIAPASISQGNTNPPKEDVWNSLFHYIPTDLKWCQAIGYLVVVLGNVYKDNISPQTFADVTALGNQLKTGTVAELQATLKKIQAEQPAFSPPLTIQDASAAFETLEHYTNLALEGNEQSSPYGTLPTLDYGQWRSAMSELEWMEGSMGQVVLSKSMNTAFDNFFDDANSIDQSNYGQQPLSANLAQDLQTFMAPYNEEEPLESALNDWNSYLNTKDPWKRQAFYADMDETQEALQAGLPSAIYSPVQIKDITAELQEIYNYERQLMNSTPTQDQVTKLKGLVTEAEKSIETAITWPN